jgi:hypothetical protein
MRTGFMVVAIASIGLLAGCISTRKPYANNPLLESYRPTLSDSETVLAERSVRRGPTQPPMPALASEQPKDPVSPVVPKPPTTEVIIPAKVETPPSELRPIIRQTSALTAPTPKPLEVVQSTLPSELKPIIVAPAAVIPEPTLPKHPEPPAAVAVAEPKPVAPVAAISPPDGKRSVAGQFHHDADYGWLQGVVETTRQGSCFVRYCDPSVDDEYGGKVQIDDSRLAAFRDGDVIAVSGELDKGSVAAKGRNPTYKARDVWLVKGRDQAARGNFANSAPPIAEPSAH